MRASLSNWMRPGSAVGFGNSSRSPSTTARGRSLWSSGRQTGLDCATNAGAGGAVGTPGGRRQDQRVAIPETASTAASILGGPRLGGGGGGADAGSAGGSAAGGFSSTTDRR